MKANHWKRRSWSLILATGLSFPAAAGDFMVPPPLPQPRTVAAGAASRPEEPEPSADARGSGGLFQLLPPPVDAGFPSSRGSLALPAPSVRSGSGTALAEIPPVWSQPLVIGTPHDGPTSHEVPVPAPQSFGMPLPATSQHLGPSIGELGPPLPPMGVHSAGPATPDYSAGSAPNYEYPIASGDPNAAVVWWRPYVGQSMRQSSRTLPISVQGLITAALQHSHRVHVLSDTPLIRETAIIEADAEFDWGTFLETKWTDLDEPVGSTLTTGGPPRFRNDIFNLEGGVRRQNRAGGQFEAGQAVGTERSNSVFFIPNNQGTSRLTMNYTHPLLRGGGKIYNNSLILLAQVDAAIARDDFAAELQNHLTEVVKAYWSLYLERGALLQRQRLYDRGKGILTELTERQAVDVVANQIVRAEAAVATRKSDLFRAAAGVKNAEARIRALVNDPCLGRIDEIEFAPSDYPVLEPLPLELCDAIQVAIRHRPEIQLAIKQIKASGVRLDVSKNELLPLLDVALETYVAGLQAERDIGSSFTDQFQKGAPSYSAGIRMEVPLRNRAAKARWQRRALEMRQFQSQLKTTLAALQLEVEIAVREVLTAYREIEAKGGAMRASDNEVNFIQERWKHLAGDDRSAGLVLEDLFASQERLANQEFEYLTAEVQYNLAMVELQKAMGTLLHVEGVRASKQDTCGIPTVELRQAHGGVPLSPETMSPPASVGPPDYSSP